MPTLLLADDSVTIQRVIELTFAEQDVRVVSVGDGEAAIARMTAERPDIVLADVGMRRVDGYQVAEHMKRTPTLAHVPVLLLTGAFEPIDQERARKAGCDGVLVKPFEPRQVLAQVRALLDGQRPADLWLTDLPRVDTLPSRAEPPEDAVAGPAATVTPITPAAPEEVGLLMVPPSDPPRELSLRPPDRAPEQMLEPEPVPPPTPAEAAFELGLDDLDLAFSRLASVAAPGKLDADTASDFQRDIHDLRSATPEEPRGRAAAASHPAGHMDWDLPAMPAREPEPEPELEPEPVRLVEAAPPPPPPAPSQRPPSLAAAFSALLAAEQTQPPLRPSAPASPALPDAVVEEAVKRVVTRMTDEIVRKVVLETAERLIREEIEKIKIDR